MIIISHPLSLPLIRSSFCAARVMLWCGNWVNEVSESREVVPVFLCFRAPLRLRLRSRRPCSPGLRRPTPRPRKSAAVGFDAARFPDRLFLYLICLPLCLHLRK